jgi:hypothetical protein
MMDAIIEFFKPYVTMFPLGGLALTIVGLAWAIYV